MSDLVKQILEKGHYEFYEPDGLELINIDNNPKHFINNL